MLKQQQWTVIKKTGFKNQRNFEDANGPAEHLWMLPFGANLQPLDGHILYIQTSGL